MSAAAAKKARRRKIWRRVRRTCYAGAALMFIVPAVTFAICYFTFEIKPPAKTAREYNTSVPIKYSNGELLTKAAPNEGQSRVLIEDLDAVSKDMLHAMMAAESADFYSNPGFSVSGIARAMLNQLQGGQGGGSTITQQYVKLSTGNDQHTLWRKFSEVVRAFKMNNQYSKDTILKAYLNTAYFGRDAYGIHNAADAYFNKTPKQLNAAESAVLAGMVQLPTGNDPRVNPKQARNRWEYVIGQMADNGWLDRPPEAVKMPKTEPRMAWQGDPITGPKYRIRERVLDELRKKGYPRQRLTRQGLRVVTTIDQKAQQAAVQAVRTTMKGQPQNLHPALVAVDPKSGAIKAYYGGGRGSIAGLDYAATPQQPGSSFKPFVTLAGLRQGQGLGETYDGTSPQTIAGTKYANARSVDCKPNPKQCGVREATTKSVNTAFVNMARQFGADKVAEAAYDAGIPRKQPDGSETLVNSKGLTTLGIALGSYGVTPTNMANAYGALADGKRAKPHMVAKIVNGEGTVVEKFSTEPEVAFQEGASTSKNLAALVTESMLKVDDHSNLVFDRNRPVASKSGTHQLEETGHNSKAWYVGYTPQISTAVSMSASSKKDPSMPLLDANGGDIFGSDLPGSIWKKFMNDFHKGKPVKQFPNPEPIGQYRTPAPTPTKPSPTKSSTPPTKSSAPPTTAPSAPTTSPEPTGSASQEPTEPTRPPYENCDGGLFDPPYCDERPPPSQGQEGDQDSGAQPDRRPGENGRGDSRPEGVAPTRQREVN